MKKKHISRKQIAIPITEFTDLKDLQNTYGLNRDTLVNCSIGWDGGVYLLYSACVPERIQGMFVDPHADTEYKALCLWINWEDGSLIGEELLLFGIQKMNLHFIQPVKDQILLLGARTSQYSDGTQDQNAVFVTRQGDPVFCTCMGDGIEQCIALEDGRIITSYFDEGVFGSMGDGSPEASGLAVWNQQGQVIWKNSKYPIWDCYAVNVDDQNNMWFYYYGDFDLVKTDFHSDLVYRPKITGSNSLLIMKSHTGIIMDGGYENHKQLIMIKLRGDRLGEMSDVVITYEGEAQSWVRSHYRSSKAVWIDDQQRLFCADIL